MEISGAVALVTGAAAGAGRAIARGLAGAGAQVVGVDRAAVEGEIRLDVTDDDALVAVLEEIRPDVLVNNAGGGGHVPPHYPDAAVTDWGAWLDLNLRAPMLATQVALRCGAGAVVNVASMAGLGADPHASPEYAAAKAGLIRFTTALADPRVSCLVPGWIRTERAEAELAAMAPEQRAAAPEAITLDAVSAAVLQLIAGPARVLVLP